MYVFFAYLVKSFTWINTPKILHTEVVKKQKFIQHENFNISGSQMSERVKLEESWEIVALEIILHPRYTASRFETEEEKVARTRNNDEADGYSAALWNRVYTRI